jgi:hypothetical protein
MTDFGADEAFAGAAAKLKEHYGIVVPVSAVRGITEEQGATVLAQEKQKGDWPDRPGAPVLIVEMDGSMLPVVEVAERRPGAAPQDRRKTRQVSWKEARLALAHEVGSVTPIFGATLGSVKEAESGWGSAHWRRERETRQSSMVWAMEPPGLSGRWRCSLELKRSIGSISIICVTTWRRPER